LDDPATAGQLATLGIRYVLLTPWRVGQYAADPGPPGRGFRLLARDSYGSLYRVTASPRPIVYGLSGFWGLEGKGRAQFQWAGGPPVRLGITAPCRECIGTIRFITSSFARPRRVAIRTSNGRVLTSIRVGRASRPVIFPLSFRHETVVELVIEPGPQSIAETTGEADPRSVSIWVKDPRFVPFVASR
jgi:hypothetical protein